MDTLDLGEGLQFPIIMNFRSDNGSRSPFFGAGWTLALLESRIYQVDDRNFVMIQPDGYNRYFYRSDAQGSLLKDTGGWVAEIKDSDTIEASAECGWKLTFVKGKLSVIQTPDNRNLEFEYIDGVVADLKEGPRTFLRVRRDAITGTVSGLEYNGRSIIFTMKDRPIVQNLEGQKLIANMAPSLRRIEGLPGGIREYEFGTDSDLNPTLTIDQEHRTFKWDPKSYLISSDNDWTYDVQPGVDSHSDASIGRTNKTKGHEFWHFDKSIGEETSIDIEGKKTITTYFTGGILSGKLHEVKEIINDVTTIIRRLSYDEKGDIIRELDSDGIINQFKYNDNGRLCEVDRDGKPFAFRKYDNLDRLFYEEILGVSKSTYKYSVNGGYDLTTVDFSGVISTKSYDKSDNLIIPIRVKARAMSDSKSGSSLSGGARGDVVIAVGKELELAVDPIAKSELLIKLGRIYSDDSFGTPEYDNAILAFKTIVDSNSFDVCSKANAYLWLFSSYLDIGPSQAKSAQASLEQLLALNPAGLTSERKDKFDALKTEAFGHLLAILRTNRPQSDEKIWAGLLLKYGANGSFKLKFDQQVAEQKKNLAIQFFNN